jgi:hypothetical protein
MPNNLIIFKSIHNVWINSKWRSKHLRVFRIIGYWVCIPSIRSVVSNGRKSYKQYLSFYLYCVHHQQDMIQHVIYAYWIQSYSIHKPKSINIFVFNSNETVLPWCCCWIWLWTSFENSLIYFFLIPSLSILRLLISKTIDTEKNQISFLNLKHKRYL